MKNYILCIVLLIKVATLLSAQQTGQIFLEQPVQIFAGGQGFILEGPTCSPDNILYFTDLTAFSMSSGDKTGIIWKYDLKNKEASVYRSPSGQANGMMFDKQGRLVVCEGALFGGRRITRTDLETGISELVVGLFDEKPFNGPNDLAIDEQGRMYFTDPKFLGHELMEQAVHGVYRVDTNLVTELIIGDINGPNGIIISPDQKTLYIVTTNDNNGLLAYDISGKQVKFKGQIVDLGATSGDGMAVDTEGNIYVTHPLKNTIVVYTAKGEVIDEIGFPDGRLPTNVAFGRGEYSSTLFITTDKYLYSLKTSKQGYNLPIDKP